MSEKKVKNDEVTTQLIALGIYGKLNTDEIRDIRRNYATLKRTTPTAQLNKSMIASWLDRRDL